MAFVNKKTLRASTESPEALFRDLRNRKVEGLLAHQADILRRYHSEAFERPDVAIELPTGSGKTLVGLLIAEFRRVKLQQRVLFLCPTRQLVRQVAEQAETKYGIKTTPFVGAIKEFDPNDKIRYQTGQTIAVAAYSALFNVNPFFSNAQTIVLDDAHSAENYITSAWSLFIDRSKYSAIYLGMLDVLGSCLPPTIADRFKVNRADRIDAGWVEKVPNPRVLGILDGIGAFLDANTASTDLQYPWSWLKGHLEACHFYVSHGGVLIRPFIPPSLTHAPFANASQRVFMSATLGRGGDLERITGIPSLFRVPIPEGWDRQGVGRRFFMFPEHSIKEAEIDDLVVDLMKQTNRALVLVPTDKMAEHYTSLVKDKLRWSVFTASDIENSKASFISTTGAAAVLANRYDGIDLIGEECRLMIIRGLPKASNLQERFLMTRMAAGTLLDDRIRTRIIQAVGRCTRSATDYAAVCVLGDDFADWLILAEKRALFHPEFQAELQFGSEQSTDRTPSDFNENLSIFLSHGEEWANADGQILEFRDQAIQSPIVGQDALAAAAAKEVECQYCFWNFDYERACGLAQEVAGILSGDETKGFRGFWYYMGGTAAALVASSLGRKEYRAKANELYSRAANCAPAVAWLRSLESNESAEVDSDAPDELLQFNVDAIEALFDNRGYSSPRKFEADVEEIRRGLFDDDAHRFEEGHRRLGELLGFVSDNSAGIATPDPWWISSGSLCLVSEDKSDSKSDAPIPVKHSRQAASHRLWIEKNVALEKGAQIVTVMITPAETIHPDAATYAGDVKYWHMDEFRKWADSAIAVMRQLRGSYPGAGTIGWRGVVVAELRKANLDPKSIIEYVSQRKLADLPQAGGSKEVT